MSQDFKTNYPQPTDLVDNWPYDFQGIAHAIMTSNTGPNEPSYKELGTTWLDSTNLIFKVYMGDILQWVPLFDLKNFPNLVYIKQLFDIEHDEFGFHRNAMEAREVEAVSPTALDTNIIGLAGVDKTNIYIQGRRIRIYKTATPGDYFDTVVESSNYDVTLAGGTAIEFSDTWGDLNYPPDDPYELQWAKLIVDYTQWNKPDWLWTRLSTFSFSVTGDKTEIYTPSRMVKCVAPTGYYSIGEIDSSGFGGGVTTVILKNQTDIIPSPLYRIEHSVVTSEGMGLDAEGLRRRIFRKGMYLSLNDPDHETDEILSFDHAISLNASLDRVWISDLTLHYGNGKKGRIQFATDQYLTLNDNYYLCVALPNFDDADLDETDCIQQVITTDLDTLPDETIPIAVRIDKTLLPLLPCSHEVAQKFPPVDNYHLESSANSVKITTPKNAFFTGDKSGVRIANNIYRMTESTDSIAAKSIDGISGVSLFADQWYYMWKYIKNGSVQTGFTKQPHSLWVPMVYVNKGDLIDLMDGTFVAGDENSRWQYPVGSRLVFYLFDSVFPHTDTYYNFGTVTYNDSVNGFMVQMDDDDYYQYSYGTGLDVPGTGDFYSIYLVNPWEVLYPIDIEASVSAVAITKPTGIYDYQLITGALRVNSSNDLRAFYDHGERRYEVDFGSALLWESDDSIAYLTTPFDVIPPWIDQLPMTATEFAMKILCYNDTGFSKVSYQSLFSLNEIFTTHPNAFRDSNIIVLPHLPFTKITITGLDTSNKIDANIKVLWFKEPKDV